jgi:ribosomal protein S18 acetylase RimI-like enzyme
MNKERFRLRPATIDDAEALGVLHVQVWRDTYADCMRSAFLESLDVRKWISDWVQLLSSDDYRKTIVALDAQSGDVMIGFASAGPSRDADLCATSELYVLNTDARCHGSGVAGRLLESVLLNRPASLWVVEQNERAQAFYRKHGFHVEGTKKWDEESGVSDIRMVRGISP